MNPRFSPTPWGITEDLEIVSNHGYTVAIVEGKDEEAKANSQLIAAAPVLLEALVLLFPHVGVGYSAVQRNDILKKAHAAIAVATGGAA